MPDVPDGGSGVPDVPDGGSGVPDGDPAGPAGGPGGPGPLAGIRVVVPATRRAKETSALIVRWGGEPMVGALLEEVPVGDEAPLRAATEDVLAAPATWSVHLTGVGTRRWFDRAASWGQLDSLLAVLSGARIVARGQKAGAALAERGLRAAWTPARETSAEIAQWLAPQLGPADTVAVQLFGEPIAALTHALAQSGARVIEVAPYVWALPSDPALRETGVRLVRAVAAGDVHAIVVTSAVQATHLFIVARAAGIEAQVRRALTERIFTAAVGEVAAGGLEREDVPVDLVADSARMGALIRSLAHAAPQVRAKAGLA
ncbi:MAG: hypothetical protein NVSMB32_12620 [Actinomycetota bacterium]